MDTSLRVAFGPAIAAAAARHHLDPRLLAAVAAQETGGPGRDSGSNVVGDRGHGHGLFQIDDRWHTFARSPAAMDPASNADYAAGLISGNLQRYGGVRAALSAYNAGSPAAAGTRTDWGDGKPLGYADSVLRHLRRLTGGGSTAPPQTAAAEPPPEGGNDAEFINALRAAAAQFSPAFTPAFGLTPVQRSPLPRIDEHDQRDLAPDTADGDSTQAP